MGKRIVYLMLIVFFVISATGCATPRSFVRIMEPTWASLELRPDLEYEDAWQEVLDILAKKFELEMISKEGGYIRTTWIHTWWKVGQLTEKYRVRVVVKFSPKKTKVDIKTEAQYLMRGQWIIGTDTRLLQTVKTDIMGITGRTTK
ncbi:MAG: hypothetical protein KAJ14_10955 [Candidatus Omnitrophica bacterium]|nr:hypothetical protein [Candidatus Omnitrophota bacterium]